MSPGLILPGEDRFHRELLAVEDARGAVEAEVVDTRDLHDATVRRERTAQHGDAALRVDRSR